MDVSVLIPAFNAVETLERAVESARDQQCDCTFEIILVDDGSSDNSVAVMERLGAADSRIRYYLNGENRGVAHTRNTLIERATGDWIAFLDSDDVFLPEKLTRCLAVVERSGADMVWHGLGYLGRNGKVQSRVGNAIFLQATLIRRAAIADLRFDPDLRAGEDSQFFAQFLTRAKAEQIPDILTGLTIRPGSLTDRHWLQKRYVELWHREHPDAASPDDQEVYYRYFMSLSALRRLGLRRAWLGQKWGRLGGAYLLDGQRARAAMCFTVSTLCDPRYLLSRLRR
jgi:glycosyltransferase involved in cell wall biosynthesis